MGVVTWNTKTQPPKPILMLTQGAHTYDVEEETEQEVFVLTKEGGSNLSKTLDNLSPPKVNKKKIGYVTRGINKRGLLQKNSSSKKERSFSGEKSKKCSCSYFEKVRG
jgi:hypothetical protein